MSLESWLMFVSIALVATLTPGPAVLLVTSYSVSYGIKPSVATMLGNVTGLATLSGLSVLGLSAVILYSTLLFTALKLAGAAYLVYLGYRLIRYGFAGKKKLGEEIAGVRSRPALYRLYLNGLFVALTNPKAIMFTTALFPQFIDHTQPILAQFLLLVVTFMSLSLTCLLGFSYLAVRAKHRTQRLRLKQLASKVFGAAFIATGALLANSSNA